ncbi:hypothetical protein H7849_08020 [Alloacidobacterium dinghuense]|uniref:Uncharacterized protein n=1 Tax=Alloacidobacterium dinghuense TaxID=2763107 RepID=A0A7G8BMS6_9BACT|nr:hypothetical protein [Alloacidobacterium dinghuense]QNI33846.1 hypothetical protein H7849_08020 [Alloacidobacterium dinghuense]
MKIRIATIIPILVMTVVPVLWCQDQGGGGGAKERVAQLKQSLAANRQALTKYEWTQTTQVNLKGQTTKDDTYTCRYGPDGQVQKTLLGPSPIQQKQIPTSGIKGKIAQKKVAEMQDYTSRLKSLISHYAPPNPEMIQNAVRAGNVSVNPQGGVVSLIFTNFYKSGDKVTFGFNPAAKKLVSYDVNTWLDDPQNDIVTMTNQFASLPNGVTYLNTTVLNAQAKQIQVTTTNDNYTLISQ